MDRKQEIIKAAQDHYTRLGRSLMGICNSGLERTIYCREWDRLVDAERTAKADH